MRMSFRFTGFITILAALFIIMFIHARHRRAADLAGHRERTALVRSLRLTDLCLFTEARYTRHPAMADRFAPFQDHPVALEHFPSGSLVTPPVMRAHEDSP